MKVDIWSDIACPWCFIGKRRFDAALDGFAHREDVEVTWHSYQLDPSLPERYDGTGLEYLSSRKGMAPEQVRRMFGRISGIAADEGLDYDFDSLVVANSLRAHEVLHLAAERGLAGDVEEALLSAHFEHGEDVGSLEVLVRVGIRAGLDGSAVEQALADGRYRAAVQSDIRRAGSLGIQGVPFFVLDDKYGVSGAQPTEVFSQALEQVWRESNPLVTVSPAEAQDDSAACGPDGCTI
ncbi:MAG: DsbA family oxidoreductase [Intrasporangium sp.]|uniref:DsbA family oxidoreductase n=1 Tax=Intrasporangium sp. TaxID=1925024 RepID=UPI002648A4AC|nr:DsbA family oxidoreductase [Intrasporangium sp.]MDN5794294.1 DsbA family oxidoreductase [Intrasporangium sp.]